MIFPASEWERIMKIQEIFARARHGKLTWKEAAEILGVDDRTVRRWKLTVEDCGYEALFDRRRRRPSPKRAPDRLRDRVLRLYRDTYRDWNIKHFHEQLPKHGVNYGYTWTKNLLKEAKLVEPSIKRDKHRKKRERKPMVGMMLHIDGSQHRWLPGSTRTQDLIVVMDDANNEIYYARLVDQESTVSCMEAIRYVVDTRGIFCSIYSDRAGHFFNTPEAGSKVDLGNLTQIGRALYEIGIQMIPAYSPQARGRSERAFRTWQGRLLNELKLHNITTIDAANAYIQESFLPWYNANLIKTPLSTGSAFTPYLGKNLDYVFCIKEQRVVNNDNTVQWHTLNLQIQPSQFRISFAKCKVIVCHHLDNTISVLYGQHIIGRYNHQGESINQTTIKTKKRTNHVLQKADILMCY